jgi:N-acetylneuraminic acid mutarotase
MTRISNVLLRPFFYFLAPLICVIVLTPSCQNVSTTSTGIGDWAQASEFSGVTRTEAVSFTIGNDFYITGGYNGNTRLSDLWKFDEPTGTWVQLAYFPGDPRNSAVGFSANGMGYIGTGYDGTNMLNDFWQYNPTTNQWSQVANFPSTPRYSAVAFSINGKGYVGTGYDSTYRKDFYQYDPVSNSWSAAGVIPDLTGSKRSGASAFVYNNIAYVVAGINNGTYVYDPWAYNATTNTWSPKRLITTLPDSSYSSLYGNNITRQNAAIFLVNDTAYLATGNYNGIIGTCWGWDFTNDLWTQVTSFEGTAREGAIGFTVNNHGYIVTGDNGSNYYDDLWRFYPDVTQTIADNYP